MTKEEYLSGDWNGWRYIWIAYIDEHGETFTNLHEIYKLAGKLSWTQNEVSPEADQELLAEISMMLADGLIFTEEELYEFNERG